MVDRALDLVNQQRPDIARVLDSIPILAGPTPPSMAGVYDSQHRSIILNSRMNLETDSLAALLIHEGTHALDHVNGLIRFPKRSLAEHVQPELRAFRTAGLFWQRLYPYGKYPETNTFDYQTNQTLLAMLRGTLDENVTREYTKQWYAGMREGNRSPRAA